MDFYRDSKLKSGGHARFQLTHGGKKLLLKMNQILKFRMLMEH